MTHTYIM